jgi:glycosyltransferase 2 family protein
LMALIILVALSLLVFLLYRTLSRYDVNEILAAFASIPPIRILAAATFAGASYFCLTWFDWLAVRCAGRPLPYRKVGVASFVSLSIGHNVGVAAFSSGAVRYRFYSRWGLSAGEVGNVIIFCGVTVALGLTLLAGSAILLNQELASEITGFGRGLITSIGAICISVSLAYLAAAATVRRSIHLGSWSLPMPPLRLAVGQCIVGCVNFAFVAGCLHQVLLAVGDVSYSAVATVYVIANVSAILSHVPGGLGVIEGIVLLLLPQAQFVAAVVMFRVIYYLIPLAIGGATFAAVELIVRSRKARAPQDTGKTSAAR